MTRTITGTDGTVGATYTWKGNKEVGSGSQTYKEIHSFDHIAIDLQFKEPFESKSKGLYHLVAEGTVLRSPGALIAKCPTPSTRFAISSWIWKPVWIRIFRQDSASQKL